MATVIGGRGFVGLALVRYLQSLGWLCYQPEKGATWPIVDLQLGHVFNCAGLTSDYLARTADTVEANVSLLVCGELDAYTVYAGQSQIVLGTRQ